MSEEKINANEESTPAQNEEQDNAPAIDVTIEDCGTLKKKLTVTVPEERITAKRDELYGELQSSAQIPGFRIGRAPRRLLEKRFGGDIAQDVRNGLVGEALGEAVEDADLKTMGEPDIKLDEIELPESGDLTFSFEVEIMPEFDLPETKGIKVTKPNIEVTDERIDEAVNNMVESMAKYEKTDDAAAEGDSVIVSAKITGEDVDYENPRITLRVAPGVVEGVPVTDLAEKLAGKKEGDTVELTLTADENHSNEAWQGKELNAELTIHQVDRRTLPEVNDEFAERLGFGNVDELREYFAVRLKSQVAQEADQAARQQICDFLLENAGFDLPEGVIKRHTAATLQRQMIQMMQYGIPQEKISEQMAQLQAAAEEQATKDLKLMFMLGKVAEEADIDVSEAEVNNRIAQMAMQYQRRPERLKQQLASDGTLEQLAVNIREEKAIDKLLEEADVTEESPKAEKKAAKKTSKKAEKKEDDGSEKSEKKAVKKTAKKTAAKKKTTKKDKE